MYLQPCDWIEHDVNFQYVVDVFGRTDEGDVARVRLMGFKPYFYLKAKPRDTRSSLVSYLATQSGKSLRGLEVVEEEKYDAMRGFQELQPTKVWKIVCPALWMFKTLVKTLKNSKDYVVEDIYEANLPPLLRLFHECDLQPASPFMFEADEDDVDDLNVEKCFKTDFDCIKPFNNISIPLYVGAYDIEVYSDTDQFPLASNPNDEIIQIGVSFRWSDLLLQSEARYVFVSGKCAPSQDPTVTFVSCRDERDLLTKFHTCIMDENPDILAGYNTFGFDDSYIADRAERLGLELSFGRMESNQWGDRQQRIKTEKKVFELASGKFAVRYIDMPGRLAIDLYLSMRREQNLESYKLDSVANTFLRDKVTKLEVTSGGIRIHTKSTRGLFSGNLIRLDIVTNTINPYKNGHKFPVLDVQAKYFDIQGTIDLSSDDIQKLEWSFTKDDIHAKDMFASHHGTPEQKALVAKYCSQDCDLVLTLMAKLDTLANSRGMADVCRVPVQYIFLRGQGIKIYSAVVYNASKRGQIIMTQEGIEGDTGYEGAIVLPPKIGMYMDQPIPVLDFNSLYPSNMIAYNLSPDTLVYVKNYDTNGRLLNPECVKNYKDYQIDEVGYDIKNDAGEVVGRQVCGYVQPTDNLQTIGLLPLTLDLLLKKRKETRKRMETTEDDAQKAVLNGLQLAYKVVANSVYGQCGSKTSPIRRLEVAASTTAVGRQKIYDAKAIVVSEFGAEVIYGDSVASYTPIQVCVRGKFETMEIERLGNFGEWKPCTDRDKEYCELRHHDVYTNTEHGKQKVYRIIRHALPPHKKMMRVHVKKMYDGGISILGDLDVTDDHSLLDVAGRDIKPTSRCIGTKLLTTDNSKNVVRIVQIEEIPYEGYVYDLTTADNHFQAGPFNIVVHNTDSIFVKFPTKDLQTSINLAKQAADKITASGRKAHKIEYEKTFYPFILFCRKRYVGMMYEDDVTKKPKRKSMGIASKRRDNAPIVKDVFGGALDILMEERDIKKAQKFVQDMLVKIMKNEMPLEKFIVSKQLRDDYKNPNQIAHAVLAERMKDRDEGSAPQVGDRLAYVYVAERKEHKKQGDRIEHLEYVREHGLNPDVEFYISNQIQNPVAQTFALALEQLDGYVKRRDYDRELKSLIEEGMDEEDATLKILKLKEKELDKMMFMGANYLSRHKRGPMDMFINRTR